MSYQHLYEHLYDHLYEHLAEERKRMRGAPTDGACTLIAKLFAATVYPCVRKDVRKGGVEQIY